MDKIKVGIIGFGLSGRAFHAGLLKAHPLYEITAVSSRRASEVAAVLPDAKVFDSAEKLIAEADIDLVINCAPNEAHFSLTKAALEQGKHVVVEKPFVNRVEEGEQLISLAEKMALVLTVFQNRRWDSDFLTVKKLLAEGRLGSIKQFESHFDRWRPNVRPERWREQSAEGSGVWYDLGSHLLDQAVQLFGRPTEIIADLTQQKTGSAVDDYFHVILKYGARRVILHASSFADDSPRFRILSDEGTFTKFGSDPQEQQLHAGLSIHDDKFGIESAESFGVLTPADRKIRETVVSERGSYRSFYDELTVAIDNRTAKAPVDPRDALCVIELIQLAIESSVKGETRRI